MTQGTIILNSNKQTFESIIEDITLDFISRGHMNRENKDKLKNILLSQHRSQMGIAGALTGKKVPLSELFSSNWRQSKQKLSSLNSFHINESNILYGGNIRKETSSTHHLNYNHPQLSKQASINNRSPNDDVLHASELSVCGDKVCYLRIFFLKLKFFVYK